MPTNLPSPVDTAGLKACLLRVARLGANCAPASGTNSGYVTDGVISLTASPDVEEGQAIEPVNGCGTSGFVYREADRVKRHTFSGELMYLDYEALELMFGGTLLTGVAGGPYAGKNVGWSSAYYLQPPTNGLYLEVISRKVSRDGGDCASGTTGFPPYFGRIFPRVRLTLGDINQQNDHIPVPFTGVASINPNAGRGPWNDSPITGNFNSSPVHFVDYSQAQFDTMAADIAAGFQTTP